MTTNQLSKPFSTVFGTEKATQFVKSKISFLLLTMVILLVAVSGGLFWKYQQAASLLHDVQSQNNPTDEDKQLISDLGMLMVLPNEEPTIATVTDREKLTKQAFFTQAENGDKVIIYTEAKKAILYRPSQKKIVEVAPLITEQPSSAPVSSRSAEVTEKVSVTLLNGSTKVGVTNSIDDQLINIFPSISIKTKEAAKKTDYTNNIVVDITGKNAELAAKIAAELGGIVSVLPDAETQPQTELLVIIGNN